MNENRLKFLPTKAERKKRAEILLDDFKGKCVPSPVNEKGERSNYIRVTADNIYKIIECWKLAKKQREMVRPTGKNREITIYGEIKYNAETKLGTRLFQYPGMYMRLVNYDDIDNIELHFSGLSKLKEGKIKKKDDKFIINYDNNRYIVPAFDISLTELLGGKKKSMKKKSMKKKSMKKKSMKKKSMKKKSKK